MLLGSKLVFNLVAIQVLILLLIMIGNLVDIGAFNTPRVILAELGQSLRRAASLHVRESTVLRIVFDLLARNL